MTEQGLQNEVVLEDERAGISEAISMQPQPTANQPAVFVTQEVFQTEIGKIQSTLRKLEEEFLRLKQGSPTLQEYTTGITEEAGIAEVHAPSVEQQVERNVWDPRERTHELSMTKDPLTFQTIISRPEMMGCEKEPQLNERVGEKRKWGGPISDDRKSKDVRDKQHGSWNLENQPSGKARQMVCYRCGLLGHMAKGCPNKKSCYYCGLPDHIRPDCPRLGRGGAPSDESRATGAGEEGKTEPTRAKLGPFV